MAMGSMKSDVVHLILKTFWWNKIEKKEKTIEYRSDTSYYRSRILGKKIVVFHKGYTNTTMEFEISEIVTKAGQIAIHLGKRVYVPAICISPFYSIHEGEKGHQ
jgi:hypothetical protein